MSWGFNFAGKPSAVAAQMDKQGNYCPQAVKDAVKNIASHTPEDRLLIVESNGHIEVRVRSGESATSEKEGSVWVTRCPKCKEPTKFENNKQNCTVCGWKDAESLELVGDIVNGSGTLTFKILPLTD